MRQRLSLRGRGVQLLSQREHSRQELRRKLLQHLRKTQREGAESAALLDPALLDPALLQRASPDAVGEDDADADADQQVDEVLSWLQDKGYFSEQRFVESRVHVREGRYGNLRIRQELAQHGVALDADTAAKLRDSELARAHEVWRRKFGAAATDPAGRAKQQRFLAQRGFSAEVIRRVVRSEGRGGGPDDVDDGA
ncbi:RecX family transcriptional regulator [Rhizobacter sp. SG703]|uniref:RecX family transcriptional regulator n=1 Tax=Rhizobacter sp. SG703 TaxID=2587140 RepID=UPI001447E80D|nr:RecX family transcriptional regulator [Rhizobacter sp. SG703]NKI96414.1 regulatory protein [Rhizobacter sp. SG703]